MPKLHIKVVIKRINFLNLLLQFLYFSGIAILAALLITFLYYERVQVKNIISNTSSELDNLLKLKWPIKGKDSYVYKMSLRHNF